MEKKRLVDFLNINPPPSHQTPSMSTNVPIDSQVSLVDLGHDQDEEDYDDDGDGKGVTSCRRYSSRFSACFLGLGAQMRSNVKSSTRRVGKAFCMRSESMASVRDQKSYERFDGCHLDLPDDKDDQCLFAFENIGKMETCTSTTSNQGFKARKSKAKVFESCKRFFGF